MSMHFKKYDKIITNVQRFEKDAEFRASDKENLENKEEFETN